MEGWGVKARPRPLLLLLLLLGAATGPEVATASSRSNERLYLSLQELTGVLRDGFNTLASELRQERASREDLTLFLKAEVHGMRRAVEGLCRGVRRLSGGGDNGCSDVSNSGGGGGGGEGGGAEVMVAPAAEGSHNRPHLNTNEKTHPREPSSPPEASPHPPEPVACPQPYRRVGGYCLTLLREGVTWEEARARCHSFAMTRGAAGEGDLAVVDDMDGFKAFVADTDFRDAPSGLALVGGSADGWGGAWVWVDGSLIKQLPWLYSQSDHEGTVLAVDRDGIFHTVTARSSLWPLCQLK